MPMSRNYSGQAIARIKKRQELLCAIQQEDDKQVVSLLKSYDVDLNRSVMFKSSDHKKKITPLIAAVRKENPALVTLILDHGANINQYLGRDYHLPLFEAILIQSVPMVKTLLNQDKLDQELTNKDQDSALIFACRNFELRSNSSLQIISLLLDKGLINPDHVNKFKRTALSYICTKSLIATEYLLAAGANTNIADIYGDTPLLYTLTCFGEIKNTKGQAELLQIATRMLELGADPDHRSNSKLSARSWCKDHELSFIIPPKKESVL